MPTLPVVENAWQMVLHQTGPSDSSYENVFGIVVPDGPLTQEVADNLADALATILTDLAGSIEVAFSWTGITVTDLRTTDGPQFDSTSSFPVAGGVDNDPLPANVAGLVSWYTSRRGRSFRGRTYIVGFPENASNANHMDSPAHGALSDFADAMVDFILPLGIISRYWSGPDGDAPGSLRDPGIITTVTSQVTHDLWKTQRRRLPRG